MEEEEGVIVEDEIEGYTPLPRPASYSLTPKTEASEIVYSDNSADEKALCDSDSDDDSDIDTSFKRCKPKKSKSSGGDGMDYEANNRGKGNKRDKFKIWSSGLQEEALTEELITSCDVDFKTYDRNRDVESYDYRLAHLLYEKERTEKGMEEDGSGDNNRFYESHRGSYKRRFASRNVKQRLGKRSGSLEEEQPVTDTPRTLLDLVVTTESTDGEVAKDIANKLYEPKEDLIVRVVNNIGKEKAIEIYGKTKKIEEDGGMMIMNGLRRRTPGGVFLFLLKKDDDITQESVQKIFELDRKTHRVGRRAASAQRRKEMAEEVKRNLKEKDLLNGVSLPALLTRAELAQKSADDGACIKSEDDRDGETPVSNPPPSPVTDGRENSSDGVPEVGVNLVSNREVMSYDDFLGGGGDDMDVF